MAHMFVLVILAIIFCSLVLSILYHRSYLFQKTHSFNPELSLILVVHNQAPIIEAVIRELLAYYQDSQRSFELVIYDDASTDETPEILKCLSRRHNFTLLFGQEPRSRAALDEGIAACRAKVIHYFLLTERVGLRTVTSLARCLSRGERIPNFGVACTPGVMSGTTIH
ncbi:MAG: glycosyltransferase [Syntrophaceticus sp.]|jgi:cellulose synthase/poly-beta-1,6-N-acetylglucosamine synthase-like glycosyltransferase